MPERTCDVCAEQGECRVDGDAYVCVACDQRHVAACFAAAQESGYSVATVRFIVEAYFDAAEANDAVEAPDAR